MVVDCEKPTLQGETWRDVAVYSAEQKASIEECNARFNTIRTIQDKVR